MDIVRLIRGLSLIGIGAAKFGMFADKDHIKHPML